MTLYYYLQLAYKSWGSSRDMTNTSARQEASSTGRSSLNLDSELNTPSQTLEGPPQKKSLLEYFLCSDQNICLQKFK